MPCFPPREAHGPEGQLQGGDPASADSSYGLGWLLGIKVRTDWLQYASLSYLHCDVCKVLQKDF